MLTLTLETDVRDGGDNRLVQLTGDGVNNEHWLTDDADESHDCDVCGTHLDHLCAAVWIMYIDWQVMVWIMNIDWQVMLMRLTTVLFVALTWTICVPLCE